MTHAKVSRRSANAENNKLLLEDRSAHSWYRFVLSFPPHLVRQYIELFDATAGTPVLDPFCGTGTTAVEAKKLGLQAIGLEAHPMAFFATSVKIDWTPDPDGLVVHARAVADAALAELATAGIEDNPALEGHYEPAGALRALPPESGNLLLRDSISPLPLHKALVLLEMLDRLRDDRFYRHERLALANAAVYRFSNLEFGPEVGVGRPKNDAPVVASWLAEIREMAAHLGSLRALQVPSATAYHADARRPLEVLGPNSVDVVITSPPYPNEKDYTRTTRLESVLLGFVRNKAELRELKRRLIRSNTRGVYKGDDDDRWIAEHREVHSIAEAIEARRLELGKTSGFERLYPRVTKLYFGGMWRHFSELRRALRPGARLAYVVGDQASYLRVMIRTGALLAQIAKSLGYEVLGLDLFRTRLATATKEQLREEVVLLRWPG